MAIHGFGEIAEELRRSTVLVLPGERGNGSGVIWSADGVIVTNAHVARVSQMRVQLWDGREFDAALRALWSDCSAGFVDQQNHRHPFAKGAHTTRIPWRRLATGALAGCPS